MTNELAQTTLDELVTLQTEKIFTDKDPRLPYIGLEHIAQGASKLVGVADSSTSSSANSVFQMNDILFGKLRPNLRKSLRAPFSGYCSTDILVLRCCAGIDPTFAGYIFQSEPVFATATATAAGTKMPRTSWNELKKLCVFKPETTSEQTRIGVILKTIDEHIAKTEVLIEKLRQVRAGLLNDLLTCGFDENGQLRNPIITPELFKDSPVGWIPTEWDVLPLKKVISKIFDYRGRTPLKLGMEWGNGDIPALSANNVEMGQINFEKESYLGSSALYECWMTQGDTQAGDVLLTMEAPLGKVAQIPDNNRYILSQRVVLLRPKPDLLNKAYLALQMMGTRFQANLVRYSSGSTAVGIQRAKLETIEVVVPRRMAEQQAAVACIQTSDANLAALNQELTKLRQLKNGLMNDLLTGYIRVPENLIAEVGS